MRIYRFPQADGSGVSVVVVRHITRLIAWTTPKGEFRLTVDTGADDDCLTVVDYETEDERDTTLEELLVQIQEEQ